MNITKTLILSLAFLALAACGDKDESEPDTTTVVEETPADETPVEPTDQVTESVDEEIEVVEESAATDDPTDEEIVLAQADVPTQTYRFQEGRHYVRLVPTQPTTGGADKVEVAEVFWYGCPHCYDLEPVINRWKESLPPNVRFVRIPATWNPAAEIHAQLYYTQEVLARNGALEDGEAFHAAVFDEYHNRRNQLIRVDAIQRLFERFGVDADEFDRTWNSFEVAQKLQVARDLARRYEIEHVPTIVVNGKFRTSGSETGPDLFDVIDELIARESAR